LSLLELRSISKHFPGVKALDGVSFDLRKGEVHALCGENGAGKSTLMKVLCGFYPAGTYGGEVLLEGKTAAFGGLRDAEEHGLALIAQELALVPHLSVAENMALGREPARRGLIRWDSVREQARRGLGLVGLEVDPDREVHELGIGQQQMVEIAKALVKDARILVLDEPTAALTDSDAERLLKLIVDLRARGVSSIYVSHRLEEVFKLADRITVLRDGRSVGTAPTADLTPAKVISMMVGRSVDTLYPRADSVTGEPALAVEGLSVSDPANPGRFVVQNVSFSVRRGEVFGIAGLMGAGRTALLSSLFGTARSAVSGAIRVAGGEPRPAPRSPREAMDLGLALVSEDRKRYGLVVEATIVENLTLAVLRRFARRFLLDHAERRRAAQEQVDALRIRTPGLNLVANQLSGGNQQKVVLGKWLMARPHVLLLDEPTRGIDVGAKAEIYELIARLARNGLAVVLVTSELPELLGLSHRMLVLSQGRQTATLEAAEATPERVMAAATAVA
jgi:D-xylose transport system ATP-binding protein